jgi:cytochrome P450
VALQREWRRRYGEWVAVPLHRGRVLFACSPSAARSVLRLPWERVAPLHIRPFDALFHAASIITAAGTSHKQLQAMYRPVMRSGGVPSLRAVVRSVDLLHKFRQAALSASAREALAFAVASRALVRCFFAPRDPADEQHLIHLATTLTNTLDTAIVATTWTHGRWCPAFRRFRQALAEFERYWHQRLTIPSADPLPWLVCDERAEQWRFAPNDVALHLIMIFVGGYHTTVQVMREILDQLSARPDVMAKVLRESDPTGPYVRATVSEALRRATAGVELTRQITQQCVMDDWVLEPGVKVAVAIGALHHDPDLFPQPDDFRPERFLGQSPEPFAFLPFGGGSRRCTGAPFVRDLLEEFAVATAEGMAGG